jgi:parvulin-like peptidyl-prolyl isomerase
LSVAASEGRETGSATGTERTTPIGRLVREPLLHFLLAGAAVFGAWAALHPEAIARDASHRIEVTADELRQISVAWLAQGRPAPTPDELRSLVESRVREEILYREALALGLDQGDTIVKRRLAQKMEFLFEDLSALREPTSAELARFLAEHAERFALPARATFRHLYFSPDRRGARARDDAARALEKLAGAPVNARAADALGDAFMLQRYFGDRPFGEVASSFGPPFAAALFGLAPGSWQGPIESGYGWHLVYVDSITPSRTPALEEVQAEVRSAWIEAQRDEVRRRALEGMRARYEIVLPADLTVELPVAADGGARTAGVP